jgi:5-methylcytosine-specific restriction endonuclease McrA
MDKQTFQNLIEQKGWWAAYSVYLSSKSWKQKRDQRLKIDNGECRTCGSQERLEIHHKPAAYKKIPNECVINDLTTLCNECHEAITSVIRHRRYQGRDIKIQFYQEPREAQKELISYGLENSEIQINGCEPPRAAQWRFSQSTEPDCKGDEENLWQTGQDRGRLRGISPT